MKNSVILIIFVGFFIFLLAFISGKDESKGRTAIDLLETEVVGGMKAVEQISLTPTDKNSIATERVEIRKVEIRPVLRPPFQGASVEELKKYQAICETDFGLITIKKIHVKEVRQ